MKPDQNNDICHHGRPADADAELAGHPDAYLDPESAKEELDLLMAGAEEALRDLRGADYARAIGRRTRREFLDAQDI